MTYEVGHGGFLDRHVKLIRQVYGERRDVMLGAMDAYFPQEVEWTHPEGGLFLWGTLPKYLDTGELIKEAAERKVAFVAGEPFHPCGGGKNTMRLNFSNATPENIREGIHRLAGLFQDKISAPVKVD